MSDDLRAVVRTLARLARLLERSGSDLSLPQYRVLDMVALGDQRASLLSARLALAKPTITAVVDGLVDRGLLVRSEVLGDRRAVQLTITPAGKKALKAVESAMTDRLRPVFERTGDPAAVIAAIAALNEALDQTVADAVGAETR